MMEQLMERLRTKSSQHKSFPELAKTTRMTLLEKRYALDAVEKTNLQKCLDKCITLQHIKVTTRQGLVERLESLTRQLGLKFMEDTSGLFISSDMFYLEIVLDASGAVQDVKVHHECKIEQQSCSELVNCLVKGDFADFTTQLEGLASIYQLNAEPKIKSKAFVALQALETDLQNLFQITNFYKDTPSLLLQSPVGIVQTRRGGHPMKLTYFVSPYELLDSETKSLNSISVDLIHGKSLGMSVTVNLEASVTHKLQIQPILNVNSTDPQNLNYAPLTNYNSTMLPASYVLTPNKAIPVCKALIKQMTQITELNFENDESKLQPLLSLIGKQASNGEIANASKGLFVTLPDQNHCYFMTENRSMDGSVIKSIPFTETAHVPRIVQLLRQQALFNTLIASCVRQNSRHDFDNMTMFEVCALSWQQISVSLEHPFEESMATVEFDLSNICNIECKIFSVVGKQCDQSLSAKLSRVVRHSLSIPVTMRALIKTWEEENVRQQQMVRNGDSNGNFSVNPPGSGDLNGRENGGGNSSNQDSTSNGSGGPKGLLLDRNSGHNGGSLLLTNSVDNSLFSDGSSSQMEFLDSQQQIKKRRVTTSGEDFWKSPKRTNNSSNQLASSSTTSSSNSGLGSGNEDSNSLGVSNLTAMESQAAAAGIKVWNEEFLNGPFADKSRKMSSKLMSEDEDEQEGEEENAFDLEENEDFDEEEDIEFNNDRSRMANGFNGSDSENDFDEDEDMLGDAGAMKLNVDEALEKLHNDDEEDEDIGSILNEIKNDSSAFNDLNDLLFSNSKTIKLKGGKDLKVLEDEKVPLIAPTQFVSITAITPPPTISSTSSPQSSSSPLSTKTTGRKTPPTMTLTTTTSTATSPSSKSVSTDHPAKLKSVLSEMGILQEKRLGIEIIPLPPSIISPPSSNASSSSPSSASVTITPIGNHLGSSSSCKSASSSLSGMKSFKKSSSSSSLNSASSSGGMVDSKRDGKVKKKRRRDDYAMGPPEKLVKESSSKSVSLKLESASLSPSSKHQSSSSSNKISPRQSPVHYSSPKHSGSPKGSPYAASASPKHGTSSGSGKPSMSALKSAANSPKSEKSSSKTASSSGSKERSDKKLSSRSNSPKLKHSSVKLKPIDLNVVLLSQDDSNPALDPASKAFLSQSQKARKSSLSAVIDKLKSAQNSPEEIMAALKQQVEKTKDPKPIGSASSPGKAEKAGNNGGSSSSTSSYIIKPSLDGMKLTINKTRHKSESNSGSSKSGSSLKTHTGLKPGVNSGPASKKSSSPSPRSISKLPFQKSNSSGNLSSSSSSSSYKSSGLTKINSGSDLSKVSTTIGQPTESSKTKDKSKFSKSSDSNNFRSDSHDVMKLLGFPSSKQAMEGFMKSLDKKFQIPKLSARSSSQDDNVKRSEPSFRSSSSSSSSSAPTTPLPLVMPTITGSGSLPPTPTTSSEAKTLSDFLSKEVPLKFPFPLNLNQSYSSLPPQSSPKFAMTPSPKYPVASLLDSLKEELKSTQPKTQSSLNTSMLPQQTHPQDLTSSVTIEAINKPEDLSKDTGIMRPPSAPPVNHHHLNHATDGSTGKMVDSSNVALDFSKQKTEPPPTVRRNPSPTFPLRSTSPANAASKMMTVTPSPSVSLHIVKSPVPSPLTITPSPHSNSPCITDDELMDEALVGISGK